MGLFLRLTSFCRLTFWELDSSGNAEGRFQAQYQQVSALHAEEEITMRRYSEFVRPDAYEMPSHQGSLYQQNIEQNN